MNTRQPSSLSNIDTFEFKPRIIQPIWRIYWNGTRAIKLCECTFFSPLRGNNIIYLKYFLRQFYMLICPVLEKKQTTYPMRGWCSLQICISRRLLWLLQLVLYGHNGCEKYWQPSHPRTPANNASIVKICSEQLVWARCLNIVSS